MRKFYRYWKQDLLNKAIVLVVILIIAALAIVFIMLMTHKTSGNSFLAGFFPTPTLELKVVLTSSAKTAVYEAAMATASVPPTITTMPFKLLPKDATVTPTTTTISPTATVHPALTLTSGAAGGTPVSTETPGSSSDLACLPNTPAQNGKVIDIVDGYTIKVLIDGLVYSVRYLGIELPEDKNYAGQASYANGKLVFGKEISLISDQPDKDPHGRLLRYVLVNETFVNLELLRQGLVTAVNTDPLFACADVFNKAEQSAKEAQRGVWKTVPAP